MKKIFLSLLILFSLNNCDRINQKIAIKHNDEIIALSDDVVKEFDKLNSVLSTYNPDSIDIALANYNHLVGSSISALNKISPVNDTSLKHSTSMLMEVFKSVGENEFKQISDMYHLPDSLYTTKEQKEVFDIATAIDEKVAAAQLKQLTTQKIFAKKNNFVLMVGKDTLK